MGALAFLDQDGRDWGWATMEVEPGTPGSLRAVSVQSLLKKYNLASFEYVKLDIEGSEWQLFRQDKNLEWLNGLKLMSLEVRIFHPTILSVKPHTPFAQSRGGLPILLCTVCDNFNGRAKLAHGRGCGITFNFIFVKIVELSNAHRELHR